MAAVLWEAVGWYSVTKRPLRVGLRPSALRTHRRKAAIGISLPESGWSSARTPDPLQTFALTQSGRSTCAAMTSVTCMSGLTAVAAIWLWSALKRHLIK